ncbi:MAG: hypothetical protein ACFFC7_01065 [Candidatus Hermodarchaeota archaeon]
MTIRVNAHKSEICVDIIYNEEKNRYEFIIKFDIEGIIHYKGEIRTRNIFHMNLAELVEQGLVTEIPIETGIRKSVDIAIKELKEKAREELSAFS